MPSSPGAAAPRAAGNAQTTAATPSAAHPLLAHDAHDKIQQGVAYKRAGNEAFAQQDYRSALHAYHHAVLVRDALTQYLAGLDQTPAAELAGAASSAAPACSPASTDGVRADRRELSQVRSNVRQPLTQMAACHLHLARYARAAESCDQALALDAGNAKAMYVWSELTSYRKAQALERGGDVYAARSWLASEAAQAFAHDAAFVAERRRIDSAIEARERTSAAALRGFLGTRRT